MERQVMVQQGAPILRQRGWPLRRLPSWVGGWQYLLLLLLVGSIAVGGFIVEQRPRLPLPPQASRVAEQFMPASFRQTTFRVPSAAEDVRGFYQRELPTRGWRYCGTQATPRCTNLSLPGAKHQIEVYRHVGDRDATGMTIEIWPIWDAAHRDTFVTVWETSFRP